TRNEIKYYEQQKETAQRRMIKLEEEQAQILAHQSKLDQDQQELAGKLDKLNDAISAAKQHYSEGLEQLRQKQKLIEEAELTIRRWEQKRDVLTSRRDTIKDLQNDFDGFFHGVKEILKSRKHKGGLSGIHGAVAKLLKVPA